MHREKKITQEMKRPRFYFDDSWIDENDGLSLNAIVESFDGVPMEDPARFHKLIADAFFGLYAGSEFTKGRVEQAARKPEDKVSWPGMMVIFWGTKFDPCDDPGCKDCPLVLATLRAKGVTPAMRVVPNVVHYLAKQNGDMVRGSIKDAIENYGAKAVTVIGAAISENETKNSYGVTNTERVPVFDIATEFETGESFRNVRMVQCTPTEKNMLPHVLDVLDEVTAADLVLCPVTALGVGDFYKASVDEQIRAADLFGNSGKHKAQA